MNNILENLEAVKKQFLEQTGYEPRELCTTGRTLIEYYRRGLLSPEDATFRILIRDTDWPMVEDYLKQWRLENGR